MFSFIYSSLLALWKNDSKNTIFFSCKKPNVESCPAPLTTRHPNRPFELTAEPSLEGKPNQSTAELSPGQWRNLLTEESSHQTESVDCRVIFRNQSESVNCRAISPDGICWQKSHLTRRNLSTAEPSSGTSRNLSTTEPSHQTDSVDCRAIFRNQSESVNCRAISPDGICWLHRHPR